MHEWGGTGWREGESSSGRRGRCCRFFGFAEGATGAERAVWKQLAGA
jgi:hypothetical protein